MRNLFERVVELSLSIFCLDKECRFEYYMAGKHRFPMSIFERKSLVQNEIGTGNDISKKNICFRANFFNLFSRNTDYLHRKTN